MEDNEIMTENETCEVEEGGRRNRAVMFGVGALATGLAVGAVYGVKKLIKKIKAKKAEQESDAQNRYEVIDE